MGSDGESDQASGTSSDEVQSPTGVCLRSRMHRRISMEVRRTRQLSHFSLLEIKTTRWWFFVWIGTFVEPSESFISTVFRASVASLQTKQLRPLESHCDPINWS